MAIRVCWIFVVLAVVQMEVAFAGDWTSLGAPACCGPSFSTVSLQQGCCETPPSCCQHVWDGYCENKRAGWCGLWSLGGRCAIGRRICLQCSETIPQECGTPSTRPIEDPLLSQSSSGRMEESPPTTVVRIKPSTGTASNAPKASSEPVIPLPPVLPDAKE